jgi:hypothetical protein
MTSAKFIIGIDAFSNPDNLEEREYITHTQTPKFVAEIIFEESDADFGFSLDSLNIIWSEPCDKQVLDAALKDAEKAIEYYTEQTMMLDQEN